MLGVQTGGDVSYSSIHGVHDIRTNAFPLGVALRKAKRCCAS